MVSTGDETDATETSPVMLVMSVLSFSDTLADDEAALVTVLLILVTFQTLGPRQPAA